MSAKSDAERVELTTKGLRNVRQFALENGHQEAAQLLGELLHAFETGADHWLLADWEKRMAEHEAEARRK
jgi:hypothetical protein